MVTMPRVISIHAPREGSDHPLARLDGGLQLDFYPRSPRGERRRITNELILYELFLSTLPARGATSFGSSNKGDAA